MPADEAARTGDEHSLAPKARHPAKDMAGIGLGGSRPLRLSDMGQWRVPLADVVVPETDIQVVADVYRSGWLSMGPETAALEADFAAYTGAGNALAVTNGTAALHLICLATGLGPGDEVVVPSMTWDRHVGHASSYDVVARGFNYRIDEPRAALARRRLMRLDAENARREWFDARYRAALEGADGLVPAL